MDENWCELCKRSPGLIGGGHAHDCPARPWTKGTAASAHARLHDVLRDAETFIRGLGLTVGAEIKLDGEQVLCWGKRDGAWILFVRSPRMNPPEQPPARLSLRTRLLVTQKIPELVAALYDESAEVTAACEMAATDLATFLDEAARAEDRAQFVTQWVDRERGPKCS